MITDDYLVCYRCSHKSLFLAAASCSGKSSDTVAAKHAPCPALNAHRDWLDCVLDHLAARENYLKNETMKKCVGIL